MAENKTIKIKAAKNAPEFVSHGNLHAENKGGYFTTDNRRFADHLIESGYGVEAVQSPRPKVQSPKSKTKAAPKAAPKPAESAEETKTGGTE